MTLEGKVAFVTGGAHGIGRAICERLAGMGAAIAIVDLDAVAAEANAGALPRAIGLKADVAEYESVRQAVEHATTELGPIDVLVNNAGWDRVEPFLDNDPALWDRLLAINLLGPINVSHVVVRQMVGRGTGRVVNVASDAGRVGSSGEAVYSACKGGVIAFTKALAREVARAGVRVNCVCPGPTETAFLDRVREEAGDALVDAFIRATPTRRLARPEEIAEAVGFFATCPDHVTGQVLSVSGGLTMAG